MSLNKAQLKYKPVLQPVLHKIRGPVNLSRETMEERRGKVLKRMAEENLDFLVIYADREHGDNFQYLTGFSPRFEEALLILNRKGEAYLLLGNESLRMAQYSRIKAEAVHVPYFSLPNQPMDKERDLKEVFSEMGMKAASKVGVAGWKMFTSGIRENAKLLEVPFFIAEAIQAVTEHVINATGLFIHPKTGIRIYKNANEIAHYEFGAALASQCVMRLLNRIETGFTEMELAGELSAWGQPQNVQAICATGERFTDGIVAPRMKKIGLGDRFTTTMGLPGGLTCRAGYIGASSSDLPGEERDYIEQVVKPYVWAMAQWYTSIGIGVRAAELYNRIEEAAPKAKYGWHLNPGHYTASEEWLSSPVTPDSPVILEDGMMLQMDIIFKVPGYGGVNAEDGIALAGDHTRELIEREYPEVWNRIAARRKYMEEVIGIPLKKEVLPMSDIQAYVRPLLLNKEMGMTFL